MADSQRSVWKLSVFLEATEADRDAAIEAIERALCPDPEHPGYCAVPWTLLTSRLEDLDPDERADWQMTFDEDRQAARDTGVDGG